MSNTYIDRASLGSDATPTQIREFMMQDVKKRIQKELEAEKQNRLDIFLIACACNFAQNAAASLSESKAAITDAKVNDIVINAVRFFSKAHGDLFEGEKPSKLNLGKIQEIIVDDALDCGFAHENSIYLAESADALTLWNEKELARYQLEEYNHDEAA